MTENETTETTPAAELEASELNNLAMNFPAYKYRGSLRPIFEFKTDDSLVSIYADGRVSGIEASLTINNIQSTIDHYIALGEKACAKARDEELWMIWDTQVYI